ncbi:MAG: response regulator transcription factor [Oscillospiraceae bacterium]|jgi:DNA-binding response OmpR family regulator|nr:response regulator transcription factor [Oscillospiraceae bacterium]
MARKILVLDDEESIRSFVVVSLRRAGYEPIEAATGEEALERMKEHPDIQVALLDIMLPNMDGLEVCRRLRAADKHLGIIIISAKTQEIDTVTGLMTGADDYMTKPFISGELIARIEVLLRRMGNVAASDSGEMVQGPFRLNTRNHTLEKNGTRIKLTQVEYSIIKMFMDNLGKVLTRDYILATVWGRDYYGDIKIVDVNISRLRAKIEDDPKNPVFIMTTRGYGYQWGL